MGTGNSSELYAPLFMPFVEGRSKQERDQLTMLEDQLRSVALDHNIKLETVKDNFEQDVQIANICRKIEAADLVVAILDLHNANVLFEVGYSMALQRPLVLVAKSDAEVPFNVRAFERVVYEGGYSDQDSDRKRIQVAFDSVTKRARYSANSYTAKKITQIRNAVSELNLENRSALFQTLVKKNLSDYVNIVDAWSGRIEYEGRLNVLGAGIEVLQNLKRGGFSTLFYPGAESWLEDKDPETRDEYMKITRDVCSKRNLKITRVYVLGNSSSLDDKLFRRMVVEDELAGINTRYIMSDTIPETVPVDFGLWDSEILGVVGFYGPSQPEITGTTFYHDQQMLARAEKWQQLILERSERCSGLPLETSLLRRSFKHQEKLAFDAHAPGEPDREDASWYHAGRQYLRLSDSVASAAWHTDFFPKEVRLWLAKNKDKKKIRVLITGLADFGMLYHLVSAVGPRNLDRTHFNVIDLSSVPLDICRWLKDQLCEKSGGLLNINLSTQVCDLLDADVNPEGESYDIVASDAFLTRFKCENQKRRIVQRWSNLLAPDGMILTTVRIGDEKDKTTDAAISKMKFEFVQRSLDGWPDDLNDAGNLSALKMHAEQYTKKMTSYPMDTVLSISELFESQEALKTSVSLKVTKGELHATTYAQIRATKLSHAD